MEDGPPFPDALNERLFMPPVLAVANTEYAALLSHGDIYITRLTHPNEDPQFLPTPSTVGWGHTVLALSRGWPNILAASVGPTVYIFDLKSRSLKHILPGTARTVTSIAFSAKQMKCVITGHVDGSICFWDLNRTNTPLQRLAFNGEACKALAFNQADDRLMASLHDAKLRVWFHDRTSMRPICSLEEHRFETVAWHPRTVPILAAATANGELKLYNLSGNLTATHNTRSADSSDNESDDDIFGQPDGVRVDLQPVSNLVMDTPLKLILWTGDETLIGLSKCGENAFVYQVDNYEHELTVLWSCSFENSVETLQVIDEGGAVTILGIGRYGITSHDIPASIANILTGNNFAIHLETQMTPKRTDVDIETSDPVLETRAMIGTPSPTMNPARISHQRNEASAFERTSKQLLNNRRSFAWRRRAKSVVTNGHSATQSQEPSTSPPFNFWTQDLERSVDINENDVVSPMPFLSPGIPSRKISPHDIPHLDESILDPPPLPTSSFASSNASAAIISGNEQDSEDSDDDSFVDDIKERVAFLPGGINVPLPKACGALFAPNGQLLTFFPPKPSPVSARKEVEHNEPRDRRKGDKTAKLFPAFGNFENDLNSSSESDLDDSIVFDSSESDDEQRPSLVVQPASFPSQLSWKPWDTLARPLVDTGQSGPKVIVAVHDLKDVPALHLAQRYVANRYRLLCDEGESGAALCEHNAIVAEHAALLETAEMWRFLAMLLDDQVPLELLSLKSSDEDVLVIARLARQLASDKSGAALVGPATHSTLFGKLRWADHPLGGPWLISQILKWAEQRADVQLLACFSIILSQADTKGPDKNATAQQAVLRHLSTYSPDYFADTTTTILGKSTKRTVPVLRRHAATITSLHESPTKSIPSKPPTPYLESNTTPPFSLPPLSRQSTRLSVSGSASPELQRSSFSAVAKYYAQSITDRFGAPGTSPPLKRVSTSPSAELSSSFPGGSWPGKSVSFASSTTEDTSRRSLSVSRYGSRNNEDGYDSDKTIEDISEPHTPKSPSDIAVVNFRHQDLFVDDISGSVRAKLIPDDLTERVAVWSQYYAELLRSWGMLAQATELEKLAGLTATFLPQPELADSGNDGMLPRTIAKQRRTACDICFTAVRGLMQACPLCSHASHLSCLEAYCTELEDEMFTCPSGCGCACSELPYVVEYISPHSPQRPTFKKKASFTDPRRWRARVEEDGW